MSGCRWPRPYPSDHRRALRSGSAAPLAKSQEGENEHNHDDQANEINQTIHRRLHAGSANRNGTLWPQIGSFSSWFVPLPSCDTRRILGGPNLVSTSVLALCLRASRSPPALVTCLAEKHSPEGQHDRGAARVEALRGRPSASARRAVIEFGLGWGSRSAHRQAAWDPCSR